METLTFEGKLTALTPIFTGGDLKTGVEQGIRKTPYIVNGERIDVPYVSGSSIRGNVRRLLLQDMFEQIGYTVKSLKVFYQYSGGALENSDNESDSGTMDLKLRREVRALILPISLLGCSKGNQAFSGKVFAGLAVPICSELNDFLPIQSKISFHKYLSHTVFQTRRAEREIPVSVELPVEQIQLNQNRKEKKEPTIQMKVNYETLSPGAMLYHKWILKDTTQLEKSCFARAIELWKQRPYVGGKANCGFGEVKIDYPTLQYTSEDYLAFLSERKTEIGACLDKLGQL